MIILETCDYSSSSSADSVQIAKVLYLQKVKGEPIDRLHSSDDYYCPCPPKNTYSWAAGGGRQGYLRPVKG